MAHSDNKSAHPAAHYDGEVRKVIPFYEQIQTETLDLVRSVVGEPATWIDTGAGTGALAERALPLFPRTRFVLADPSSAMLAVAQQRFAGDGLSGRVTLLPPMGSAGLPRVARALRPAEPGIAGTLCCTAEGAAAGPANGAFCAQVVTAIMCHHYLEPEERREAVRGCFEVIEPGGVLVVFENVESESPRGRELTLRRWHEFQLRQGRSPEAVDQHLARFGTELKPVSIAEHLALFREVGFGVAEVFWRAHMQAGFFAVKE